MLHQNHSKTVYGGKKKTAQLALHLYTIMSSMCPLSPSSGGKLQLYRSSLQGAFTTYTYIYC